MFRRIMSVLLAVIIALTVSATAFAGDAKKEITLISSNVAGLPIPSAFSDIGRVVPKAQKTLGQLLNATGADIICVQEDFQYHARLAAQMKDYKYSTFTSDGVPVGDGLNIFSKYPIYNVDRQPWKEFFGILEDANDGLTPKGFLKCTVDVDGFLFDLYNVHIDANGAVGDQLAKKAQLIQLSDYIKANSAGRPIMMTGDWNLTLHSDLLSEFYEKIIVEDGFRDAWAELINGGDYFRGEGTAEKLREYESRYGSYWGRWDSVERVAYRDGDGAVITPTEFEYEYFSDDPEMPMALTDHAVMTCKLSIDTSAYTAPSLTLKAPKRPTIIYRIVHGWAMFFRSLGLIIKDSIRLIREKTQPAAIID